MTPPLPGYDGGSPADNRQQPQLRAAGVKQSEAMWDAWRATRLRDAADTAWRAKDYPRIVEAYSEMISELRSVELRPSELGRLRYAEDRLDT